MQYDVNPTRHQPAGVAQELGHSTRRGPPSTEKLVAKLDQVSADWTLIRQGDIDKVIWFGTEPVPESPPGRVLRDALAVAGIQVWVVPWH